MKRRASVPDEQLALEGLVSLSGHHTASSPSSSSAAAAAGSLHLASHLPWNASMLMTSTTTAASHDDKPASENKHHHHHHQFRRNPPFASCTPSLTSASSSAASASASSLSSAPPSESKLTTQQTTSGARGPRGARSAFSAKDALKDALEHSTATATTHYTSIHPPSSFFASTSSSSSSSTHGGSMLSMPTSPLSSTSTLSSPRSSFSLPPLSATLASLHSTATATATTPSPSPRSSFCTATPSTSSSTPASSSRRASISASALSEHQPPAKRTKLDHHHHAGAGTSSPSSSSPMSSPRTSFSVAGGVPMMDDPPEDAQLIPVTARIPQGGEVCIHIEKPVLDALTASGISPESIVDLIVQNDKESRDQVIRETGFSTNYIMKLQRRVLHSSSQLQLPPPVRHSFGPGVDLHVLFDSEGGPLFMKKELCTILGMKGTTFSYWKKKSNVEDTDTSKDFRLMDICRTLFGGRATYTLYSPTSTLTILNEMETSRQKNSFSNLAGLKFLVTTYGQYGQRATKLLADPNSMLFLDAAAGEALSAPTGASTSTASATSSSAPATATPMAMMIGKTLDGASAAADAVSAARSAAC